MFRIEKPREPDRELTPSQLGKPVRLDGKVVVLLGGGYSWTSELAFSFASAGAAVVMGHRKTACGEKVVEQIEAGGGYAAYVPTDPRDAVAVERLYDAVLDELGHVDIAFNGIEYEGSCATGESFGEEPIDPWFLEGNLSVAFNGTKVALRHMKTQSTGGWIINLSAPVGINVYSTSSVRRAAERVIGSLTRYAAREGKPYGVRVNAIATQTAAGTLHNEVGLTTNGRVSSTGAAWVQLGALQSEKQIAQATLWLCSEEAQFVTGFCAGNRW